MEKIDREKFLQEQAELKKQLREMVQDLEELKKPAPKPKEGPTPPSMAPEPAPESTEEWSLPLSWDDEDDENENELENKNEESEDELKIDLAPMPEPETPSARETSEPKNLAGFSHDEIREYYFELKNRKHPKFYKKNSTQEQADSYYENYRRELEEVERQYNDSKRRKVENLLTGGDEGKAEAKEFLLNEVELKRKNDIENGSLWTKIKTGINKGITYWEEIGNNPDDNKSVRLLKKTGKTIASVAIIGGASAGIVSALALLPIAGGVGTAAAVSGSYLGKRIITSVGFGTIISILPNTLKPFASKLALGFSITSIAGIAGYGASKLSGIATKKWLSEEAIAKKTKEKVKKLEINLDTLETNLTQLEKEYKKIIKEAEKKRTYRRLLAGTVALATSVAFLEVVGHKMETEAALEAPAVSETPSNFREEIYILKANEDGYDAVNNLRAQMEGHYHGDYSQAPKNAQDFMNTDPKEEAIKLGLVDPMEDRKAYPEGSILKFDDQGRLLWRNPGFEKDAEPFDQVLIDSPAENIPTAHSEFFQDPKHFESEELVRVYDHNIHSVFPKNSEENWTHYQKEPITAWYNEKGDFSKADEELQPLLEYIAKLHEVTELEPREGSIFTLQRTETVEEYVTRALRYAEEHNILDQVKLE